MKNIPQKIYLQVDPENEKPEDFNKLTEVTWCQDRINDTDLEYKFVKRGEKMEEINKWRMITIIIIASVFAWGLLIAFGVKSCVAQDTLFPIITDEAIWGDLSNPKGLFQIYTPNIDSIDAVCKERGHVFGEVFLMTAMGYSPYFVDLPDRTLYINHDPNTFTQKCLRCGKDISKPVQAKPNTTIIWKRGEK